VIKTVPTLGRIAVMALFALSSFAACLYLWMAFGGSSPFKPQGYQVKIAFPEATQLANQSDVRISGVSVGKVIKLDPDGNRTRATIELKHDFAPIPTDTKAILRVKSLLGETYVELTPGNRKGPELADGGTLKPGQVAPTVELDEILATFDAKTQKAFRTWMESQAAAVDGRGPDINAFFGELPGFTDKFNKLLVTLDAQQAATTRAVSSTGEVFDALSEREGELRGLVTDSARLFGVTAARNKQFAGIFQKLPRFERESTETLPKLTAFGNKARPAIQQLQPAATAMGPAFTALDKVAPQFDGFFGQLKNVVDASEQGLPALNRILKNLPPLLGDFQPFLRNANPIVDYIGQNKREATGFFSNLVAASGGFDIGGKSAEGVGTLANTTHNVHYLRTAQMLNLQTLTFYPHPIAASRTNPYAAPGTLLDGLKNGQSVFGGPCAATNPQIPTVSDPPALAGLAQAYAYRTTDPNAVAAPACKQQGAFPGFTTEFPQLRAEP
jgi:phospholipid/cholesterol/gamma-HCH transport system substrate-binding protein